MFPFLTPHVAANESRARVKTAAGPRQDCEIPVDATGFPRSIVGRGVLERLIRMTTRALLSAVLLLSTSTLTAFAAATPEEAARIKASFETYLGQTPGVVTVVPDGNAYTITLDPAPYIAKIPDASVKAFADPYVFKAEPTGNGQWAVTSTGTWGFQMSADKAVQMSLRVGDQNWSGTYDENLTAFTKSSSTYSNIVMSQTLPEASGLSAMQNVIYNIGSVTMDSSAVAAGTGVDVESAMVMNTITSATTMTGLDGQPAAAEAAMFNYTVSSPKLIYNTSGKGLSYRPILDLLAWFVARPDKQLIIKDQVELKAKLHAALPLFQSLVGTMKYEGLNVTTAVGQFEVGTVAADVNMNGLVKDGFLQEKITFAGFKMPAGLAPPWMQELVPTNVVMDFAVKGFDLAAPTQMALGQMDLSQPEPLPAGFENVLLPAFLPSNAVTIDLGASEISNALYSLTYDGQIVASLADWPSGKATLRMKGMDAVIAKLQANAADPNVQQALAGLIGAKGFGKAEPDGSLIWVVDASTPSKVLVNGIDMSAMLGLAPPPAP